MFVITELASNSTHWQIEEVLNCLTFYTLLQPVYIAQPIFETVSISRSQLLPARNEGSWTAPKHHFHITLAGFFNI